MTVVQVHPDSASMEYHMTVAGPTFPGFAELITLPTLDVYGEPSEELLELLRRKVRMLGDATVVVHELQAEFTRVSRAATPRVVLTSAAVRGPTRPLEP